MQQLGNAAARRLFLSTHALGEPPEGPGKGSDLLDLITRLGFVQIDSVCTVERAHHMILGARRQSYRPRFVEPLLGRERALFEHWTHDAAMIPMTLYPLWQMRFARDAEWMRARWSKARPSGFVDKLEEVRRHVEEHGPVSSAEIGTEEARGSGGWWDWHPSKTALEFLWRSGVLSVTRREGFRKIYDLTERVIPLRWREIVPSEDDARDALCFGALDRLGFATHGEIAAFWDTLRPAEVKLWAEAALAQGSIEPVRIATAEGSWREALARPGLAARADAAPEPTARMRVLSPFDPALRDRARAERLFGFHYRIEIFVPAAKRRYGYYVFPLLEGARLVGRVDMAADRARGVLRIDALWPERGVRWGSARQTRFEAAATRVARQAGLGALDWSAGWLRAPIPPSHAGAP